MNAGPVRRDNFFPGWFAAWAAVLAVGIGLRIWQLGDQILIDDEWHALHKLMWAGYREIFLSFGVADYSIPLTLLFNLAAETIGLTEWRMRALPLMFGIASIALLPWLMRPWLQRETRLLFGALLAISPVLIHFSRYVRPYAMVLPLGFLAVISLWRWWHEKRPGWAAAFFFATVLAAWLHPLTVLFTGAALLWFAISGANDFRKRRDPSGLIRILVLGAATTLATAVLILPPLLADPWAMEVKAGVGRIRPETLVRAWALAGGTANAWMLAAFTVLFVLGASHLVRHKARFAGYWLFMAGCALATILVLEPAWIHHGLAVVRYTLIALPMVLVCAAIGTWQLAHLIGGRVAGAWHGPVSGLFTGALVLGLYLAGPLPKVYDDVNQFTNHLRYQFDYDFERNPVAARMRTAAIPPAYRRITSEPGDWRIVEAPWHFESTFSALPEYQRVHRMPVRIGMISGLCTDWTHGELRPDPGLKIRFDQFVFLNRLLKTRPRENLFVVFHRDNPFEAVRVRELPGIESCIDRFREAYGAPWHEDDRTVVFRLSASA